MKKLLITGGCGFLGSNLAQYGIQHGYDVCVFDNLSRIGASQNLKWLQSIGKFTFIHGDIRNRNDIETVILDVRPSAIFHVAGQVAMTSSILDPYKDFQINTMGTVNLLDAVRKYSKDSAILYSSTNKVYGDLEQFHYQETETRYICEQYPDGFPETVDLDFRSPYGCSKGAADQYCLDFCRIYGLRVTVFRHSSMYGGRQFATSDQGWIGWFCEKAIEKLEDNSCQPFTISGNGKQVRDILHADDMISLYYTALEKSQSVTGNAYNVGGSVSQSLSLLELFALLEDILGIKLSYNMMPPRQSDQKVFVADITKVNHDIGWKPTVNSIEGISKMLDWVKNLKQ
ncbi:CDP-paratose 2-epimerase [Clostridia bacterium]|nr:CDP-paratose 2-epimerase [Clostridia bacterium]